MLDRSWSSIAIQSCIERDIDHFFVAPGSRCTPLTLAIAHHSNAVVTQHFDERALTFAALGYARATGKPGVFVCTSGTAVANAFPAVIEASMEGLPMLLFTADRPPELRGTGANQTIDQQRIFGDYVRWFFDMPCPNDAGGEDKGDLFVYSQVMHAIDKSRGGPVHLNWMFREPFSIEDGPTMAFERTGERPARRQPASVNNGPIRVGGNTIVAVGGCTPEEARVVTQLAGRLNAPLVTDITSQWRGISPEVAAKLSWPRTQTIVHVGGRIVSKTWLKFTAELPVENTLHVHLTSRDLRIDPNHLLVDRHVGPLDQLAERVQVVGDASTDEFLEAWQTTNQKRVASIDRVLAKDEKLSEPGIARSVGRLIGEGQGLFIGNSTPIRDFDWYSSWPDEKRIVVGANRGASGIDGLIASAVGFAKGINQRTVCVLGDLSALHDLNSLALVAQSSVPLTIVVNNNQGGWIFDMLPIRQSHYFERYFATPHEWGFADAAKMFGLEYLKVQSTSEFAAAFQQASTSDRSTVIEAITDHQYNMAIRHRICDEVAA